MSRRRQRRKHGYNRFPSRRRWTRMRNWNRIMRLAYRFGTGVVLMHLDAAVEIQKGQLVAVDADGRAYPAG